MPSARVDRRVVVGARGAIHQARPPRWRCARHRRRARRVDTAFYPLPLNVDGLGHGVGRGDEGKGRRGGRLAGDSLCELEWAWTLRAGLEESRGSACGIRGGP
eukprot:356261-Chlamydomonas_euryale.AAC.6